LQGTNLRLHLGNLLSQRREHLHDINDAGAKICLRRLLLLNKLLNRQKYCFGAGIRDSNRLVKLLLGAVLAIG
jgi:hypothetical protein